MLDTPHVGHPNNAGGPYRQGTSRLRRERQGGVRRAAGAERPLCDCGWTLRRRKNGITCTIVPDTQSQVNPCSANAASPVQDRGAARGNALRQPALKNRKPAHPRGFFYAKVFSMEAIYPRPPQPGRQGYLPSSIIKELDSFSADPPKMSRELCTRRLRALHLPRSPLVPTTSRSLCAFQREMP